MTPFRPFLLTLAGVLLLAGCGSGSTEANTPAGIEITGSWVRATEGSTDTTMTGAFMEIANEGSTPVSLTGASSPVAAVVQIHTMTMRDGAMVMEELEGGLKIEPSSHQHLRPGSNHVMLMGLKKPLRAGDEVPLTLEFSDGTSRTVTAPVKVFTEEEDHYDPSLTPSPSPTA